MKYTIKNTVNLKDIAKTSSAYCKIFSVEKHEAVVLSTLDTLGPLVFKIILQWVNEKL